MLKVSLLNILTGLGYITLLFLGLFVIASLCVLYPWIIGGLLILVIAFFIGGFKRKNIKITQ